MAGMEITKEKVLRSPILAVIDFWGPKCVPCMALMPKYHELADNPSYKGKVKFCSVDTSKNRRVAITLKVMGTPAFLYYKGGKEIARVSGESTTIDSVKAKIDELVA